MSHLNEFIRRVSLGSVVCCLSSVFLPTPTLAAEVAATFAPTAPRKERSFQLHDAFQGSVYAEPPEVRYPVCLTVAPDGTLFVGVDENGSIDRAPNRGRVVRCRDLNQDGRGDVFVEFIPEVDSPRGLVWDGEWLYVLHPPDISAWRDTNGDGVADEKRVLVEGIGFDLSFRGADHTSNGIQLGIDGWIYAAIGDYGFKQARGADGRTLVLRGGGVVRVRPDGAGLELVARGLRNIYDVAVSPLLERFTRDNTNDGGGWDVRLSHIIDLADYGYPSLYLNFNEEIMPALADYGGGSPTGSLWIQEPALPEPFDNMLFTCEWGRSKVLYHPLRPMGASYQADQKELVTLARPTDMDVDASGRIYVASWEGGGFTYSDPEVGWLLEIRPRQWRPQVPPDLKAAQPLQLVEELAQESSVRRLHAQRELLRRPRSEIDSVRPDLLALARDGQRRLEVRVAALFTAKLAGAKAKELIPVAEDAALRAFVVRALADDGSDLASDVPTSWFLEALREGDPRSCREALIALARLQRSDAAEALFETMTSPDRALSHTARKALVALGRPEPALQALSSADEERFQSAQMALREMHSEAVVAGLETALREQVDPARRIAILTTLVRLYHREETWKSGWWGTRPDTTGPYYDRGTWEQSDRVAAILQAELNQSHPGVVTALGLQLIRHRVELEGALPVLLRLAREDATMTGTVLEALLRQRSVPDQAAEWLLQLTGDAQRAPDVRAGALEALSRLQDRSQGEERAIKALSGWAGLPGDMPAPMWEARQRFLVANERLHSLSQYQTRLENGLPHEKDLAWAVLAQTARRERNNRRHEDIQAAVDGARQDPAQLVHLLRGIGMAELKDYADLVRSSAASDVPEVRQAALWAGPHVGWDDLAQMAPPEGAGSLLPELKLEDILDRVAQEGGNKGNGEKLFLAQGCNNCHTVNAEDPVRGPYLGDIAKRYNRRELASSILRPNAVVAQGFESQWFRLKNEFEYQGFVVSESGDEVRIRDVSGQEVRLAKTEIEERGKSDRSIMPEGLADNLTLEDLASLLAYLEALANR